jgi:basic membrane protein A
MRTPGKSILIGALLLLGTLSPLTAWAAQNALICYGNSTDDQGFNQMAQTGVTRALSKYEGDLTVETFVNSKEIALKSSDVTKLEEKWSFVIGVGSEYEPIFTEAAKKHPLTKYIIIDSFSVPTLHNMQCVRFNNEEMGYLAGIMASAATDTKKIGFIGYDKNNLGTKEFLTGFTAGAAMVDPQVLIKSKFVKSYTNPKKLMGLADDLYDSKIDVIFGAAGGSGKGLWQAAPKHKALFIGCDADQSKAAPAKARPYVLGSIVKDINHAVYDSIKDCMEGKFKPGQKEMNYRNGGISYVEGDKQAKTAKVDDALLDANAQLTLNQADLPQVK